MKRTVPSVPSQLRYDGKLILLKIRRMINGFRDFNGDPDIGPIFRGIKIGNPILEVDQVLEALTNIDVKIGNEPYSLLRNCATEISMSIMLYFQCISSHGSRRLHVCCCIAYTVGSFREQLLDVV